MLPLGFEGPRECASTKAIDVLATLGPLHNWDAVMLVGILGLIVLVLVLHYWGPTRR